MTEKEEKKITGLTSQEAHKRLLQHGDNVVFKRRRLVPLLLFLKTFKSPLLIILIAASIVAFLLGEQINASILLVMVLISAILDFINVFRSEKAVENLLKIVFTTATVFRDGKKREVDIRKIVPGDLVFLSAGDIVPADAEILEAKDFFVNEAALTGESFPVEKEVQNKKLNLAFMGTSVVSGFATVRILTTGRSTEFGKIAASLQAARPPTDFEKSLQKFSFFILIVAIIMVVVSFSLNFFIGRGWLISILFATSVAVALSPELLPVIISVSLSNGSLKMARQNVIVKNLSSIQDLGSMNILCVDKTGTITQNLISLIKHTDFFGRDSERVLERSYLVSYYHTGVPNPLDTAVRSHSRVSLAGYKKIDEIPFDFERKRQSIVVEKSGRRYLITDGAPEEIFKICSYVDLEGKRANLTPSKLEDIKDQFESLSRDGFRVLAVAQKEVDHGQKVYPVGEENQMTFLGFAAFLDPAKATAHEAIEDLEELGIEVKILTGDNPLLSEKIARDVELKSQGTLTGSQIDRFSDKELRKAVLLNTIFARVTPEQKERIILALKKAKNVVGYLGDGINDAPSLRAADVGISVNNAVDVTKETADILLLRKSLLVLKEGVLEGRKTFLNARKYIMMGLSSNFGDMFSMTAGSAFLPFLPMQPTQIILDNLAYDASQLALTTDNVDDEDVKHAAFWDISFIARFMLFFGILSSVFDLVTFLVLFFVFRLPADLFQTGWFLLSVASEIFVIFIIRTKKIPFLQSRPSVLLVLNTTMVVALAWILPFTPLAHFFNFAQLGAGVVLVLAAIVVGHLLFTEILKRFFFRFYKNRF